MRLPRGRGACAGRGRPDARGLQPGGPSPSAFADHFTCPLPTEGNTLGFPVAAGERRLLRHR
ncbi:DUF1684 domain-containing protein [Streptacidiphilus monticola]